MWVLVSRLPVEIGPLEGGFQGLALPSLSFRADAITWPMGMAISTLSFSRTADRCQHEPQRAGWLVWAGDLGLAALGMAAVMSGNPSTMLLAWTVVDLIELGILLRQLNEERMRRRAAVFFATNLLGTIVVFAALIAAGGAGVRMNLTSIPEQAVHLSDPGGRAAHRCFPAAGGLSAGCASSARSGHLAQADPAGC